MKTTNNPAAAPTAGQIIWSQLTLSTKMACGARDVVHSDEMVMFRVGGRALRKIIVTLDRGTDTYLVDYVKISRKTFEAETIDAAILVYAEQLNETIYHLVNR